MSSGENQVTNGPPSAPPRFSAPVVAALAVIACAIVALIGFGVATVVGGSSPTPTSAALSLVTTSVAPVQIPVTSAAPPHTSTSALSPVTSAPPATAPPSSAPSQTAPACDAQAIFNAAVAKEGFDPNDPSYAQMAQSSPDQAAGAYHPECLSGWAMATISRPSVGTTDGDTLFQAQSKRWVEISDIGAPFSVCTLENYGVPADVAARFAADWSGTSTC